MFHRRYLAGLAIDSAKILAGFAIALVLIDLI